MKTVWEPSSDPELLAAAARTGLRVEWSNNNQTWLASPLLWVEDFANQLANGTLFRIPARVVWPPLTKAAEAQASLAIWFLERAGHPQTAESLKRILQGDNK